MGTETMVKDVDPIISKEWPLEDPEGIIRNDTEGWIYRGGVVEISMSGVID